MKTIFYAALFLCLLFLSNLSNAQCPAAAPAALTQPTCPSPTTSITGTYTGQTSGTSYSTGTVTISSANVFLNGGTLVVCSGTLTLTGSQLYMGFNSGPVNLIVNNGATLNITNSNVLLYTSANLTNYGTINISGNGSSPLSFVAGYSGSAVVNQGTINITATNGTTIAGTNAGIVNNGAINANSISLSSATGYMCLGASSTLTASALSNTSSATNHPMFTTSGGAPCVMLTGAYTPNGTGNTISSASSVRVCVPASNSANAASITANAGAATVTYPCTSCSVALPVVLKSFTAAVNGNGVLLNFETLNESNINFYEVEKSQDGEHFNAMNRIAPYNTAFNNYETTDNQPYNGKGYYRLRIQELDGSHSFSTTTTVNYQQDLTANNLRVYPNPAQDVLYIAGTNDPLTVTIHDQIGRIAYQGVFTATGTKSIDIRALPSGIYTIQLGVASQVKTLQFVKTAQ